MSRKIYASIDIGSDTIKFIVAELINNKLHVLSSNCVKSKGIRKGLIFDPNLATNAIKDGIKEINEDLGINIKKVIVNIPSNDIKFMFVTGSINIKDENGIIGTDDINHVIKESVYSKISEGYELMTVIPLEYIVDDKSTNTNPIGQVGQKLDIKGIMVSAPKKNIYSVLSIVEQAGLEVVDITLSGLGDYNEVRNESIDKKVGAIINLGHETTTVSIINKSILMNTSVIQLGGINVDKDLSYIFGINIFDSRTLKEKFASSHKRFVQLNDTYVIKNTANEKIKLNQIEVSEAVMSRIQEILEYAKKKIIELTKQEVNYIIITGGLTEIKSFKNLAFEIFGKGVIIYTENTLGARDNKYTTSLGMIKYFDNKMKERGKDISMIDIEDEKNLITINNNNNNNNKNKSNTIINKILDNFIVSKEEK